MITRRVFLKSTGISLVTLGFAPSFLARTAEAAGTPRKLLVAIFQRGAVDGLNMIVPYGDPEYYRLRPTIAIARPQAADGAIDLDGYFGLHPRMSALTPLWRNRSLAIVHASGSPDSTRSHFDAQDYMETATPGVKSTKDGWLNRYLQVAHANETPLTAIALASQMPRSLQGPAPALAMANVAEFGVRGGMRTQETFEEAYQRASDQVFKGTANEAFDAMRTLSADRRAAGAYRPAKGAVYPRSPFGQAMQEIARLAKADVGLEIAFAESTQWDHHVNEGGATGQIANRLADFANGIAALTQDLGDRMADTVILTMSEFGRTVAENGSRGTDHGHGNAMLAIGGRVRGGLYGDWPGLAEEQRHEGRDLAITTDFRDVFGEVLMRHLGAGESAAAKVFPRFGVRPARFRKLFA
jgi:uncharacterized protein (DUF1501 family)